MKIKRRQKVSGSQVGVTQKSQLLELTDGYFKFHNSCQIPFLSEIYLQVFGEKNNGLLIEIGAFDGLTCSNSFGLTDRGWESHLIEPVEEFYLQCEILHKGRENVSTYNLAISSNENPLSIYKAGALSTANPFLYKEYQHLSWSKDSLPRDIQIEQVRSTTLNKFISDSLPLRHIDLIIIDVEGFECEVMKGFDLALFQPTMVIIELADFHPTILSSRSESKEIFKTFIECDYVVIYKDSINTIFLRKSHWDELK